MKHCEIKNGCFYLHKYNYPVKVLDKDYNSNMMSNTSMLSEVQDSDYSIRNVELYADNLLCEIRRDKWDVIPREKEPARFNLVEGYTVPTDITMYECIHCKEDGIKHKLEYIGELSWYEENDPNMPDFMKPKFWNQGRFRVCTGCKRKDGPWITSYGD